MTSAATIANLRRKSAYVDRVQLHDGYPLPSWIDLNLTELCNRSGGSKKPCVFCPRIDPGFYPNQKLYMSLDLAEKIGADLRGLEYQGVVVLCGFGEPMLHPDVVQIVRRFQGLRVELVTNGDFLSPGKIVALQAAGVSYFVVSMYDGSFQVPRFESMFAEVGCKDYLLRDRWHTEADAFGLKLTNRAGTVTAGHQEAVEADKPCHYPAYQMTVDWNGDALLCPQDWHKKVKFGSLAQQTVLDVWLSSPMIKRRLQLIAGRRCDAPCSGCNTDGTLHGFNHVEHWHPRHKAAAE